MTNVPIGSRDSTTIAGPMRRRRPVHARRPTRRPTRAANAGRRRSAAAASGRRDDRDVVGRAAHAAAHDHDLDGAADRAGGTRRRTGPSCAARSLAASGSAAAPARMAAEGSRPAIRAGTSKDSPARAAVTRRPTRSGTAELVGAVVGGRRRRLRRCRATDTGRRGRRRDRRLARAGGQRRPSGLRAPAPAHSIAAEHDDHGRRAPALPDAPSRLPCRHHGPVIRHTAPGGNDRHDWYRRPGGARRTSGRIARMPDTTLRSLVDDLASPDPAVRDDRAYAALARLVRDGGLGADDRAVVRRRAGPARATTAEVGWVRRRGARRRLHPARCCAAAGVGGPGSLLEALARRLMATPAGAPGQPAACSADAAHDADARSPHVGSLRAPGAERLRQLTVRSRPRQARGRPAAAEADARRQTSTRRAVTHRARTRYRRGRRAGSRTRLDSRGGAGSMGTRMCSDRHGARSSASAGVARHPASRHRRAHRRPCRSRGATLRPTPSPSADHPRPITDRRRAQPNSPR